MINLNFSISELCQSDTAKKHNILNIPSVECADHLLELIVYLLQPIRDKFGAIKVTSGYRCYTLNKMVDGVYNSNHLYGFAADIIPQNATFKQVYDFIVQNLEYDECFIEKSSTAKWLHVAYRKGRNRKKCNPNYII